MKLPPTLEESHRLLKSQMKVIHELTEALALLAKMDKASQAEIKRLYAYMEALEAQMHQIIRARTTGETETMQ